ncbi:MAG TPA: hypothetical protein VFO07_20885 [Roseiflexaceae bacterium]|nr:hypothetical protein [Roseiflexaceae bacterium]
MNKQPPHIYTAVAGIFLLLQGTSTLAFRLYPPLDRSFPALLAVTQMTPPHSVLHILTGVVALAVLLRGGERGPLWFAAVFGVFYSGLAFAGMSTHHPTIFGLQSFDHPFHLFLGVLGVLVAGWYLYHIRRAKEAVL